MMIEKIPHRLTDERYVEEVNSAYHCDFSATILLKYVSHFT